MEISCESDPTQNTARWASTDLHLFLQYSLIHYTMSGGAEKSALAIVTVDSPKIILAADPLYALVEFFMSAFPPADPAEVPEFEDIREDEDDASPTPATPSASTLAFRVEVISSTILILASDSQSDTQAIQLTVEQLLMSQQVGLLSHVHSQIDGD